MRIEKFRFEDSKYEDKTNDETAIIRSIVTLLNVNMTFEVDPELEEYKERYTTVIWIEGLEFYFEVKHNHETRAVEASVTFYNFAGGSLKSFAYNFPSNPYTQLIGKEVRTALALNVNFGPEASKVL